MVVCRADCGWIDFVGGFGVVTVVDVPRGSDFERGGTIDLCGEAAEDVALFPVEQRGE